MAIVRIARPPGMTAEIYDAINRKLELRADHPSGLIMHSAGEVDGAWQIVEVWESEDDARRFIDGRLMPAVEAVAGPRPDSPPTTIYELHKLITP